ncbi:mucin-2-like [Sycon ciliatum]|uniref:mucin-2-like n=1 Tax=Sycon ciliatum TaxID=27933 RepID=UPI0031F6E225
MENQCINQTKPSGTTTWIGIRSNMDHPNFNWTTVDDGNNILFHPWADGQPNHGVYIQLCVTMWYNPSHNAYGARWDNLQCSLHSQKSVCQRQQPITTVVTTPTTTPTTTSTTILTTTSTMTPANPLTTNHVTTLVTTSPEITQPKTLLKSPMSSSSLAEPASTDISATTRHSSSPSQPTHVAVIPSVVVCCALVIIITIITLAFVGRRRKKRMAVTITDDAPSSTPQQCQSQCKNAALGCLPSLDVYEPMDPMTGNTYTTSLTESAALPIAGNTGMDQHFTAEAATTTTLGWVDTTRHRKSGNDEGNLLPEDMPAACGRTGAAHVDASTMITSKCAEQEDNQHTYMYITTTGCASNGGDTLGAPSDVTEVYYCATDEFTDGEQAFTGEYINAASVLTNNCPPPTKRLVPTTAVYINSSACNENRFKPANPDNGHLDDVPLALLPAPPEDDLYQDLQPSNNDEVYINPYLPVKGP